MAKRSVDGIPDGHPIPLYIFASDRGWQKMICIMGSWTVRWENGAVIGDFLSSGGKNRRACFSVVFLNLLALWAWVALTSSSMGREIPKLDRLTTFEWTWLHSSLDIMWCDDGVASLQHFRTWKCSRLNINMNIKPWGFRVLPSMWHGCTWCHPGWQI